MRSSISQLSTTIAVSLLVAACGSTASRTPITTPRASGSPAPATPAVASASASPSVAPTAEPAVWLDAGELLEPRNATNVVVLGTGEVMVVGSDYETSWGTACGASTDGSDSVEIGDPQTGVWKATTNLPNLRDAPVAVALPGGRALVTGGAAGESIGWSAYSSTYVFDTTTRAWSRSGLLNTARTTTAATVLLDGRVLVAGGLYMDRASAEPARVLDSSELWDPGSGAWSRVGRLAQARAGASAVTLADGRVLIVGGVASLESAPNERASAETYDPDSGEWSHAGTLSTARSGFVLAALSDGGALVAGGFGGLGTTSHARLSTVERFDPVSNSWSAADDLLTPAAGASGIRLADGRVLLAGGSAREPQPIDADAGTYVSGLTVDASVYDPETGTWTATTPMPSPRAGASAVLLADGSALFVGGSVSEGEINSTPGCPEAHPHVVRYVPGS
jgi:N-acetylneuraminic acid mutarotase